SVCVCVRERVCVCVCEREREKERERQSVCCVCRICVCVVSVCVLYMCVCVEFEMTAPVLVEVPEEVKMWEPAIYTLSFLLPSAYQERPPTPTNDKLYFSDMPDMDVYVRSYGGWMLSITSRLHAHLLSRALLRAHAHFNHTHHYAVGYDSPLKLLNRHNEVWYLVEGDPVCGQEHTPLPTGTH
uniref:Heme-binding protein soul5, like n=1 Tax=Cyprinus carpio TaxID=7962 RepID=A0A8C1LE33_CYPCA